MKKTGSRFTKEEREKLLATISEHYLSGFPQAVIAQELGVCQQQVSRYLKELRRRWVTRSEAATKELIAAELAKIDNLEREYWDAWRRSVGTHQIKTTEQRTGGDGKGGKGLKARNGLKASVKTEDLVGAPEFLKGIQWCIERRCKMLGLDKPVKFSPTNPAGDDGPEGGGGFVVVLPAKVESVDEWQRQYSPDTTE